MWGDPCYNKPFTKSSSKVGLERMVKYRQLAAGLRSLLDALVFKYYHIMSARLVT